MSSNFLLLKKNDTYIFNRSKIFRKLSFIHERWICSTILFGLWCVVLDWATSVMFAVSNRATYAYAYSLSKCSYFALFMCIEEKRKKIMPLTYQSVVFYDFWIHFSHLWYVKVVVSIELKTFPLFWSKFTLKKIQQILATFLISFIEKRQYQFQRDGCSNGLAMMY